MVIVWVVFFGSFFRRIVIYLWVSHRISVAKSCGGWGGGLQSGS